MEKQTERDYPKELHETIVQIYSTFDALLKVVGACKLELDAKSKRITELENADEDRKNKLMDTFDKIKERE